MVSSRSNRLLTGQRIPSVTLSDDLANRAVEAFIVADLLAVLILAVVVAVHLFVQVPEQVERFHGNIRALQSAFN